MIRLFILFVLLCCPLWCSCGTEDQGRRLYDTCRSLSDSCNLEGAYFGVQQCIQTPETSTAICTTECRVSMLASEGAFSAGTCYDFTTPSCDDYYFGCKTGCCEVIRTYVGGPNEGVEGWVYGDGYCVPSFGEVELDPQASGLGACGT